ncbi:hypothetical protein A0H81_11269 [Grifola frondosa]|uniref:Rho-GAP domain-containing protein n=1 Tax=Grifola frondosa TaxID=5627 RepID=A0A1C7LVV9_GRIFR|nr:hypothetical protein A0H81_11269 [Grifola frondosa]
MNKLIFQAGVDYETRPMVVMNASALPDPEKYPTTYCSHEYYPISIYMLSQTIPSFSLLQAAAIHQAGIGVPRESQIRETNHASYGFTGKLFGVPLEQLMGFDGEKGGLPRVVKDCIQYLRECGLQEEGLFRRSPSSVLLKQAAQAYDRGHVVSLTTFGDPHWLLFF